MKLFWDAFGVIVNLGRSFASSFSSSLVCEEVYGVLRDGMP